MNDLALVGRQIRYEQKSYWRNPASALFTFAFPLVFFFVFASIFSNHNLDDLGHVKAIQYYTPSILGYAIMSTCFVNITMMLAQRREAGILKRLRGTPLPAWALVGGVLGSALINTLLLSVVALTFARVVYDVSLPAANLLPMLVTILVAALAFCAIGIAASAAIPNPEAGPAIVNLPYFVLVFISGTYFPVSGGLARIANFFPLRPFILALYRSFDPRLHGSVWAWSDVRKIAIWGVAAAIVSARRFRWMPRRG